jgi:tetratricopeptide (TPR) repeat protein
MARVAAVLILFLALYGTATADDLSTCAEGSGDVAVVACTRALDSGSLNRTDRVRAYNNRGILRKRKGDYDRAIADFAEAIRINPKYSSAYTNRGVAYAEKHDYDRALADYNIAIRLDPKDAVAYNNRGVAWKNKGEYDLAIADYNTALKLDKNYVSAYNNRGVALYRKGDNDRALVEYNTALRLAPNDADVYNNRGISFNEKGDLDRAIADYSEAIRLNPKYAFAYNNRGYAWKNKGEYDLAIADYSEALRLDPKYVNAVANRAFTYEKKGKLPEALADFRSALEMDPSRRELNQDVRRLEQRLLKPAATEAAIGPEPVGSKPAATSSPAQHERRVALVIGNGTYENAPVLPNPRNDAVDMAGVLRKLGFDVIDGHDLDRREMEKKIREFSRKIEKADLALFYYAGHGLQITGKNYLVPIDAKLEREGDLSFEAIDVDVVLQQLENGPRANLVFLDACRNNPLARNLSRSLGIRSAAVGMGLASIQGGIGTMIVYATQPNNVALDGDGRNSPFTAALLAHLPDPGVDISILLRRVRADVIRATNQKQVPWDHSSLVGELVLARQ